ncbi:MAG: hypothetical protein ACRDWW_02975, partial [Acidimicrobiales bacterium]
AMADVRYVVLSDLHFGATNSLLTTLVADPGEPGGCRADPATPAPLLEALLGGLAVLVEGQETPPTLILAGDVLDLALSPEEVAATCFGTFVDLAFGSTRQLFAPVVYYLPGNHDHHVWEGTRETVYAHHIRGLPLAEPIPSPSHTTDLRPGHLVRSESNLVSTLIRRRPECSGIEVGVGYPNLALVSASGHRAQVVSHGHYTEPIYTLMSRLRAILFPAQADAGEMTSVETLERENFAWIDFLWSTLGRSGDVGIDVAQVYADLQSASNLDVLADRMTTVLASRPHNAPWVRGVERVVFGAALRREVRHVARAERATPGVVLTDKGRAGVRSYLQGAVRQQVAEQLGTVPAEVGFVFGHTHKPFLEAWDLDGYTGSVQIANSGGWVVDTSAAAVCQGGAAVLIDDDFDAAVVQFYRQAPGGVLPVQVLAPPSGDAGRLAATLTVKIDAQEKPWSEVSAAAERGVAERWQLQANLTESTAAAVRRGK